MKRIHLGVLAVLTTVIMLAGFAATAVAQTHAATTPAKTRAGGTPNVFSNIPVSGTTAKGTFTGQLDVTRFVVKRHRVWARGTLTGVVKNSAGAVVQTIPARTVSIPVKSKLPKAKKASLAAAGATCQILHLTLGPLDLNLLGLQVHLNQVVLDITAVSGPGKLLGNLLCGIANLLNANRPPLGVLAVRLNRLLNLSRLLQGINLTGTTQNGGTFTGTLDVKRLAVVNGKLSLVGVVNGVVKDASGAITKTITNAPVTIPLAGANGTCSILHLELGPLDLDLLGLQVHLSRIVLDVTAHTGPGNLLGNLLCSIAHLLDQNNLQAVVDQLNGLLVTRTIG
jgi:hypothetical protein